MTALWSASEAAAATGGRVTGDWIATGISIDSRTVRSGDLFVALEDQRDGHEFVAAALEKGAVAALVSHVPEGVSQDRLLIVEDTLEGLTALGRAARARTGAKVVAVTGSVGKTGSKEMLRAALGRQGQVHAAEKSYNNHWGVPLTLARMPRDTAFAVIEIGMNAPGEIAPLARLARPHLALITTVAAVHLEAFGSIEGIAHEKAEIAQGLEPGGVVLLNLDCETFDIQAAHVRDLGARAVSFGADPGAKYRLSWVTLTETATTVQAVTRGVPLMFKIGQPGRHLASNALGVLAAVDLLGMDVPRAAMTLASWSAPEGRGARWRVALGPGGIDGSVLLIDESYNANPAAMRAAFEVFALSQPQDGVGRVNRGRRIALLADMLELGPQAEAMHAALANHPALGKVDLIHCAGPLMRALYDALPIEKRGQWAPTSQALAGQVRRLIDAGDVVMCKGSLGSKAGLLVDAVKALGQVQPWDGQGAE